MAAVEVPQTLEYRGGQLNAAPVLEVENFTNWKKRFMCHIIGIEPQFENIISNGPYIPMAAGQRKPEGQWTADERKAANLDQRLKSLIMSVLPNDQMNSVINCLTAKSTWDNLILYHEGPFLRNTNHVNDSKLASLFGKLKYEENLMYSIYETKKSKSLVSSTPLSTTFFSSSIVQDFLNSPDDEEDTRSSYEYLNDLEEEYQARAILAKSKRFFKKGTQKFSNAKDDEEVSSDENEVTEVKALMALIDEEKVLVGKESARNGDWTKISMKKHVNTEILKETQNLKFELKELTSITETWLNSSNIVNQCINEQIPTQKKKILGIDKLTEDTSGSRFKDLVFVKSLANNLDMSITSSNIPKSSETEDSTLPNQDTDEVHPNEAQRNTTNPLVVFSDSLATDYDSADESLVCSTLLPPLKKLDGVKPVSGPKTFKLILKSKSTFKAKTLKGIIINEPSSAPAGGKSSSASKTYSAPAKLNELKLQISKKKSSYSRNKNAQQVPLNALQNRYKPQFKLNYELCGQNNHLSKNFYEVLFCKKCKRTNHRTCDHVDFMFSMNANQHHNGQGESSSRSRPLRPSVSFPSCIHYGYNDHHSNDCLYYPTYDICGSYDHDTHDHNTIISLRRGINPRNPQHVAKNCETCGSNVHTTSDQNDIEWFRKRKTLLAKNAESFKASKNDSSSALRSNTPTKRWVSRKN
ncbi:hypothetical protein Tco_1449561 [Tanacetum coccineum]